MEGFVSNTVQSPYLETLRHTPSQVGNVATDNSSENKKNEQPQNQPEYKANNLLSKYPDPYWYRQGLVELGQNSYQALSEIDQTVIDTVTAPEQNKKQRVRTAIALGGSVVVLGGATLALTRGKLPKTVTNYMGKFIENLNKKAVEIKQKPSMSKFDGTYLSCLQATNKALSRVRGVIFNISPLKDVLFEKLARNVFKLGKPCDAITGGFRKLAFSTVKGSYRKAGQNLDEMARLFADTNARIASGSIECVKPVEKGTLKIITDKTSAMRKTFDLNFSEPSLVSRTNGVVGTFKNLGNRVFKKVYGNLKGFVRNVDEWTSFVPEVIVEGDKTKIMHSLAGKRKIITNNPANNYKEMSEILTRLEHSINPNHKASRETIKALKGLAKEYIELSGEGEAVKRGQLLEKINVALKMANKTSHSEIYSMPESKKISSLLNRFGRVVNTDKKGYIEEILSIYKSILPEQEYKRIKKIADKAIKSLNKAVNQEGGEYVDKLRDFATGSALTDVAIGMAVPVATTSIAVSLADSKEKKRSIILKYGIPLGVGLATTTTATLKLIAGGKSLLLGAATSAIANELCEQIDKRIKNNNQKKEA